MEKIWLRDKIYTGYVKSIFSADREENLSTKIYGGMITDGSDDCEPTISAAILFFLIYIFYICICITKNRRNMLRKPNVLLIYERII